MKAFYLDNLDVATFVKALDECKGQVILYTEEGDRFNLNLALTLMMRQCFSDLTFLEKLMKKHK